MDADNTTIKAPEIVPSSGLRTAMKSDQLIQNTAATLASLFLILTLCAFCLQQAPSTGERLILTRVVSNCGDGQEIFFRLGENQVVDVNGVPMPTLQATSYVGEILKTRAEKVIYFSATANTSVAEVETVMARLRTDNSDVFIFAVTSRELNSLRNQLSPPNSEYAGNFCIAPSNLDFFSTPKMPSLNSTIEYQPIM